MSTVVRTETRNRGFFGWIFLIIFWLFNAFMAISLFAGLNGAAEKSGQYASEAGQAGYAIGTAIGVGMILSIWVMGALLLGLFALLTRGKKVIVESTVS